MPHLLTKIGRGHVPIQVEYDIVEDTPDTLDVEVSKIFNVAHPDHDISDEMNDSVFASFEADCRAHEIHLRTTTRIVPVSAAEKKAVLDHITRQLAMVGGC